MAILLLSIFMLLIISISALPNSLSKLSHHHQQESLLQLKAVVSKNTSSLPDWTPLHHFCNWTGIGCHSDSHSVDAINLTGMGLDGTVSPVLGNLSSIRFLDLSHNYITGNIPPELGQLPNVWIVALYDNRLQGTIPPALSACRSLYTLALDSNQLHGSVPPELSLLPSLKFLHLGTNSLTGNIPPSFKNLSVLVELGLEGNQLYGLIPTFLGNLSALTILNLGGNHLQGPIPSELFVLAHIQTLYLDGNKLSGIIPSSLTNMSMLAKLALTANDFSGTIPPELGTLTDLQYLSLWGNRLTGAIPNTLGNCSSLEALALNDNQLGGTVPLELGKLNLLSRLFLHSNQLVSDSSNTLAFLTALTNCSHLQDIETGYNHFTGILPPSIGQLSSSLYYLSLSHNMISGNIPQQILNLTNLTYLGLHDNLFGGNIPSGIGVFQNLEELHLGANKLEGSIPSEIGEMEYLGLLNLSNNQLSGNIPHSLCNPQQLRRLLLHHNKLSGNIPAGLKQCQKLELLDLSYNKLGGRIPAEVIASLENLQFYLNLSSNSLEGSLPQEMSKITMAQAIDVSGNQLTGVIPNSLEGCTALQRLNLSHNAFVSPIPDSLSRLKNLEEMDLSFNNLSGQIPDTGLFPNKTVVILLKGNAGLCGPKNYSLPPCLNHNKEKSSLLKKVVLSIVGTFAFVLCFSIIGFLYRHKFSRHLVLPSRFSFEKLSYPKFSYEDLVNATSGFHESSLLGVGNFGNVYKGILRDGKMIAIKILNLRNEEALKSFKRECKLLGRIRHRNLIRIISAFFYPDLKGLVLEFAPNGSLERHLYPHRDDDSGFCKLGLSEYLNIAVDVAHGMEYLHHDCPLQIVHCDLKPNNVLLDANMTALVTDFGISRLTNQNSIDSLSTTTFSVRGSIGYIAPEYGLGANVSIKGDIYSYGILILEMVTRRRPSDEMFVGDMSLPKWVRSAFPNRLADIVDSGIWRGVNENIEENSCLISFIHIGLLCSNESPRERPSMKDVAKALESLKTTMMGGGGASTNLTATISELLDNTNLTGTLGSDSQSSSV